MFKLFKTPVEVKDTCYEIELGVLDNLATNIIQSGAIALAKNKKKTVHSVKKEGLSPNILAHILITNTIQVLLGSGQYHVYRGVLNAVGDTMLESWDHSVNQMESLGKYSSEEAIKDKEWLRDQIKKIG